MTLTEDQKEDIRKVLLKTHPTGESLDKFIRTKLRVNPVTISQYFLFLEKLEPVLIAKWIIDWAEQNDQLGQIPGAEQYINHPQKQHIEPMDDRDLKTENQNAYFVPARIVDEHDVVVDEDIVDLHNAEIASLNFYIKMLEAKLDLIQSDMYEITATHNKVKTELEQQIEGLTAELQQSRQQIQRTENQDSTISPNTSVIKDLQNQVTRMRTALQRERSLREDAEQRYNSLFTDLPITLTPGQRRDLQAALLHAFYRRRDLEQMVTLGIGENLAAITDNTDLTATVFELIAWADSRGKLRALVQAALEANPNSHKLQAFIVQFQPSDDSLLGE